MQTKKKYGSNIVEGAISLTVSGLIVKFLGLIYKVPLSYMLSDEGMGYFNSAYTVYTFFFIICTAGVPKAISILTSEAEGEGDFEKIKNIYRTAFNLFFILGSAVTVLFLLLAMPISKMIGNSGAYFTMLAIAPSILFTSAAGVIRGYFNGKLSFLPIAVSEIIGGASRLFLGLCFAFLGHLLNSSLEMISALTILGTTLGSFFSYMFLLIVKKREKKGVISRQKNKLFLFSPGIAKRIFAISIPITLTATIGSLNGIIDLAIIMKRLSYAGYSELQSAIFYGNYTTLAIPMLNLILTLIAPMSMILLPIVSKKNVKHNNAMLSESISFTVRVSCIIVVPLSFIFLFKSREVLSILFEDSSAAIAAPQLALLAPGILFMCLTTVINTALEGVGKTKVPLVSLLAASLVKFAISFILIGNANFGILGAPIGTTVSYFVSFSVSAFYAIGVEKIKINFISSVLPMIFSSMAAVTLSNIIRNLISFESTLIYVLDIASVMFAYLIMLLILCRKDIKNILNLSKYTKK